MKKQLVEHDETSTCRENKLSIFRLWRFFPFIKSNGIGAQGVRYLAIGIWNTLFGIAIYTLLIKLFGPRHYLLLGILSSIITITNAYICYKLFVFMTKGNIIREYLRFYSVYGISILCGLGLMYVFVDHFKFEPITSNIIVTIMLSIISFLGHRYFSFRPLYKHKPMSR